MSELAKQVVADLFSAYVAQPSELPTAHCSRIQGQGGNVDHGDNALERVVADYIAGMTDRHAAREHARLTGLLLLSS